MQRFGRSGLNFREALIGFYFQDDFNVRRGLTLNLGLRYDYETLLRDTNNLAPRVGFAWDPKGDGKTVIRGAFGIFYATIESSLINRESNFGPQGAHPAHPEGPLLPGIPGALRHAPFVRHPHQERRVHSHCSRPQQEGLSPVRG